MSTGPYAPSIESKADLASTPAPPSSIAIRVVLVVGIALAAIVAIFIRGDVAPWAVAGLGLALGVLTVRAGDAKTFLLAGAGLTVALISIQVQPYNPEWLTEIVLYEKVFITHALLAASFFYFTAIKR